MRQTRSFSMSWRRSWKVIPVCTLAFAGWGCQQPPCFYYGYAAPPCVPVAPAPTGTVCDPAPSALGATSSSDAGNSTGTIASPRTAPRVVVSEPDNGMGLRLPWKRSSPDLGVTSTVVEGAVNDPAVNRQ